MSLVQDITGRKGGKNETAALKNAVASELEVMTRLHEFTSRLLASTGVQSLLEEVLSAVIAIQHADFGNLRLYNPQNNKLEIVAQFGFNSDFLEYFKQGKEAGSACGRALRQGQRVIIEDIEKDAAFAPHRSIAASAGFRAVQSTPLFNQSGEPLGVISTHFREPHRPSERELRLTDLFAAQAAQVIERERNKAALDRYQRELRALMARVMEVQEVQRKHLARELHDAIGQKLAVLGMDVAALAQVVPAWAETLSDRITHIIEEIGRLSRDVHQISRQLHPAILDDLGLEAALKNECLMFSEQHGIATEFDPVDIPRNIPDDIALSLYRVAQECLRNAAKHAYASFVRVRLSADKRGIEMEVADEGEGFDVVEIKGKGGLGLVSADERARMVNGKLCIRSQPGQGTVVTVRVPWPPGTGGG